MKKLLLLLTALSILSCTSTNAGRGNSAPDFSDVVGKDWKLIEVYVDGKNTQFSRDSFQNNNFMRDMFTLKFSEKMVNGTGAPNMFGAQYTQGSGQSLSISPMMTTLMAPMPFQPENLTELNFYAYLQGAAKWGLANNNLIINSKTEDNHEIRLVFGL